LKKALNTNQHIKKVNGGDKMSIFSKKEKSPEEKTVKKLLGTGIWQC